MVCWYHKLLLNLNFAIHPKYIYEVVIGYILCIQDTPKIQNTISIKNNLGNWKLKTENTIAK